MGTCLGVIYADPGPKVPPNGMLNGMIPSGRLTGSNRRLQLADDSLQLAKHLHSTQNARNMDSECNRLLTTVSFRLARHSGTIGPIPPVDQGGRS